MACIWESELTKLHYDCISRCSFCWMISEFMVHRNSANPPMSSPSIGTNCNTCLSHSKGWLLPVLPSSPNSWLMQVWTLPRKGSNLAAASGQNPTHTSNDPTAPEGGGHLNVTERKHTCRQSTTAAVTRVRAENTGSSRASPEVSVCRENTTQPRSCRWYNGSPSCSVRQPVWGTGGSAENVNTKSWFWFSPGHHTELLPNTRHRLFLFMSLWRLMRQILATSDKMEPVQTTWQESQGVAWLQSTSVSIRASFKYFNSTPSQNGEFLSAGRAVPMIRYHESTQHSDRGPSSTHPIPSALLQCFCTQKAWQPLSMRSLQLRVCSSLRSLKEPVCFFCPKGRPAETLQHAGLTMFREIHRLRGRKLTYTQK